MKAVAIFALFASLAAANVARAPAPVDCIIESGFDRPGGDYKAEHIETFDACVDACKLDDRCFVVCSPDPSHFSHFPVKDSSY